MSSPNSNDLTSDQLSLLSQYVAVLSSPSHTPSQEEAKQVLESAGWDLERAVGLAFDGGSSDGAHGRASRENGLDREEEEEGLSSGRITRTETETGNGNGRGRMERFGIDDSRQELNGYRHDKRRTGAGGQNGGGGNPSAIGRALRRVLSTLSPIVTFPLSFLFGVFSIIGRLLRPLRPIIPLPSFSSSIFSLRFPSISSFLRNSDSSSSNPSWDIHPSTQTERYIISLEEETGWKHPDHKEGIFDAGRTTAMSAGGSSSSSSANHGPSSSSSVGPSQRLRAPGTSSSSSVSGPGQDKLFPPFLIMGYEEAVKKAKDEIKVLIVGLESSEMGAEGQEWRRNVLTDPLLRQTILSNDLLMWIGDVRNRDAYLVSQTLKCTIFPAVCFVCPQPRNNSPSSLSSTTTTGTAVPPSVMKMMNRLAGPPSTTTSAQNLVTHITTAILPRVVPYISRLRNQKKRIEEERMIRRIQDMEYEEAARKDRERVLKKRREEEERVEREREERERREREERERERLERERVDREEGKKRWREWARRELIPDEPNESEGSNGNGSTTTAKVGVKLPDGRRIVRRFRGEDTILAVYAFVECEAYGIDPSFTPSTSSSPPPDAETYDFGFKLVTLFPRKILNIRDPVSPDGGKILSSSSVETIGKDVSRRLMTVGEFGKSMVPNANLIVEGMKLGGDDDDDEEEEEEEEE